MKSSHARGPDHNAAFYSLSDREKAIELRRENKSIYYIAEIIGCNPTTIARWLKQSPEELPRLFKIQPESLRKQALEKLRAGKSQGVIARDLNIKQGTVSYWKRKYLGE